MEFDTQLLHDLLDFLRTLEGVALPPVCRALREKLINRTETALSAKDNHPGDTIKRSKKNHAKVPSNNKKSPSSPSHESQDSFCSLSATKLPIIADDEKYDENVIGQQLTSNHFLGLFSDMNFSHAKARAYIYGQLHRRDKFLFLENIRSFWAALVGWHFLIYNNRGASKPSQVLSIKECRCRPVATPQHIAKKLSKSTFELFYNENKCFQFIAPSPSKMEYWVSMVRQSQAKANGTGTVERNQKPQSDEAIHDSTFATSWRNSNSGDENDGGTVITDMARVLANSGKNSKSHAVSRPAKQSTLPKPAVFEAKAIIDEDEIAGHSLSRHPKVMKKNFGNIPRPPPVALKPSAINNEELVYDSVGESLKHQAVRNANLKNEIEQQSLFSARTTVEEDEDQIYADVEIVRDGTRRVRSTVEAKKHSQAENIVADERTYDNVQTIEKEIRMLKGNENFVKEITGVIRETKNSKQPPTIPAGVTPIKSFFSKFRHKSDSSQVEETRQDSIITTEPSSPESDDDYVNKEIVAGHVTYVGKKLDPSKKSYSFDFADCEADSIYDDVTQTRLRHKDQSLSPKSQLENKKKRHSRTLPSNNSHKNMTLRLDNEPSGEENFPARISRTIVDDNSAEYKKMSANSQDSQFDQIYENVSFHVQKTDKNEEVQLTSISETSSNYTQGLKSTGTSLEKNLHVELNQLLSLKLKKSAPEMKFQNRFGGEKKPHLIVPLKYSQLTSTSEEQIYANSLTEG